MIESNWDESKPGLTVNESPNYLDESPVENPIDSANIPGGNLHEVALVKTPKIWAVGGGKGGVGKSLISANFSLSLAKRGYKVIAIDLDIGGSNLHTCLGLEPPRSGLADWVLGRVAELKDVISPTPIPNLQYISGSNDTLNIPQVIETRVNELMEQVRKLDADHIILDLGAGTHSLTTGFFLAADSGILSILPEPTSVENAYRFIRAVYYHRLKNANVPDGVKEVIDAAMDPKNILGMRTPADLMAIVDRLDKASADVLRESLKEFRPSIVINQVRSQVDVDVGRAIGSVCRRYFGIDVLYAGYLDYDNSVWKAVRAKRAVIQEFPHSILANRIDHMTRTLLGEQRGLFP